MTWNSSSRTTALCECSTVRRPVADFLEREEEGIPHGRRRREQMGEGRDIGVPVEPNPTEGTTSLATAAASQMRRLNGECSAQRPKTAWNRSSDSDTNTHTAWNRSSDSDSDTDTLNDVIPFASLKGKALDVKDGGVKKKKKKYQREESSQTESDKNGDEKNSHSNYDHLTRAERRYMEQKQKIDIKKMAKVANKSYKDRMQDFNQYLANLSEHYDIPKVGPG
ncbi:CGI-like protein [Zea mays]|uniref:CGI-like protein n=1 Tax=Zea mays TaxID=4577 RepID=A0A1D6Q9I3_MAIZE|nr:CGI-like protein [Zea mays]